MASKRKVHAKDRTWHTVGEGWPVFEDYLVNGIRWGHGKRVTCLRCKRALGRSAATKGGQHG
jgi:hypothetical protein